MVLVDAKGHATYVERTLEDDASDPDEAEWRLSTYEFDIRDTPGSIAVAVNIRHRLYTHHNSLSTGRFHMTSCPPYVKRRSCLCSKQVLWELKRFLM